VSEPTTGTATRAARPARGGRGAQQKHAGLTRNQWIGVGVVGLVAVGILIYIKRKQAENAAAQSSTTTAATAASSGTGTCDDGSTVPCGGLCADGTSPSGCDQSGELSTLQTELGDLESALAQGQGGGGSGGVSTTPVQTTTPPATPTTSTTSTASTSSTGTTATATAAKAGAISNLQASGVGTTTAKVSWNKAANATQGYAYKVTDLSSNSVVKSGNTTGTSVSLTGLKAKTGYNFGVQGLPGGPGDNIHFTTT
jgi:cytoskeletal protein RodZ